MATVATNVSNSVFRLAPRRYQPLQEGIINTDTNIDINTDTNTDINTDTNTNTTEYKYR